MISGRMCRFTRLATVIAIFAATSCQESSGSKLAGPGPLPPEQPSDPEPAPPPPPPAAPARRILVRGVSQLFAPYTFPTQIEIQGENLDLAISVRFPEIPTSARILERSRNRLLIATPELRRWARSSLLVQAAAPTASADTIGGFAFVGPLMGDTLVYEFRNAVMDSLYQVLRWADEKMPLKVYLPRDWPADAREVIRRGMRAWENIVRPGVPAFGFLSTSSSADIVWRVAEFPDCGGAHPEWEPGKGEMLKAYTTFCNTAFFTDEADNHRILTDIAVHETGHMLGLWRHSPRETDVMGGLNFTGNGLSRGDTLTVRRLYELAPGFQPQPR